MNAKVTQLTDWQLVLDFARATQGKGPASKPPSPEFKRKILKAMHSPIRALMFRIDMTGLRYWVSVHLVRHKIGVEHFVRSQRSDITGVARDSLPQDALVDHTMILNAEAFINISRKRLCRKASPETREAWAAVMDAMSEVCPELYRASLKTPCQLYGECPEMKPCTG